MSLILHIDTATEKAQISIAKNAVMLKVLYNDSFKDHASFLQPAIERLMKEAALRLADIDAIAITAGPGSYTGLRVGMASAKGLCYALQKPLISLNTLEVMAESALSLLIGTPENETGLLCPMIDARRMEVYTAIYDRQLQIVLNPSTCILSASSFEKEMNNKKVTFFGNGAKKWEETCNHPNAIFKNVEILPGSMARLAERDFIQQKFSNLANSEPDYLKNIYTTQKK